MRVKAFAKINLVLEILGVEKNGYHLIDTVFQQINLYDELIFEKISGERRANSSPKIIIECSDKSVPIGPENTVSKALQILENYLEQTQKPAHKKAHKNKPPARDSLKITIKKNIPVAAGLGGGSSDAAATLKTLIRMWKIKISPTQLQKLAAEIGMDVPFFLCGGTGYGTHFGEKVTPLPNLKIGPTIILMPTSSIKQSTQKAYKKIDAILKKQNLPFKTKNYSRKFLRAVRSRAKIAQLLHNDFDSLYEEKIDSLQKKLYQLKATAAHVCGAGPAVYAMFQNKKDLHAAQKELSKHYKENITMYEV